MQILARIGAEVDKLGNAHRGLSRQLALGNLDSHVATSTYVDFPLWDEKARPAKNICMKHPIMCPHDLLHSMYTSSRPMFDAFILGDGSLEDFWSHVLAADPRFTGRPAKRLPSKGALIPLRLHGDGVPIGRALKRSMDVISVSSMTGRQGATWDTKFFRFGCVNAAKNSSSNPDDDTMLVAWKILLWSFAALLKGKFPYVDWDGKPFSDRHYPHAAANAGHDICGGFRFALWQVSADLDYLCNYLQLRHFW